MKPILFVDFDGTLCHDRFWRSIGDDAYEKIQEFLFGPDTSLVMSWMRGEYTAEEVNQMVAKELAMSYETVWNIFVEDCKDMHVSPSTLETIGVLRDRFETILITDNMDCFTRFTVPVLKLDFYFDVIVNSFYTKALKKDHEGEFFLRSAQERVVSINECMLIDDSKTTCNLFDTLGGNSCVVTPEYSIEYWLEKLLQSQLYATKE